jgi:hypothetical protein
MQFLPFHDIYIVNVYGLFIPEYGHDNCQTNSGLGCGNRHGKKHKQLALHGIKVMGKRHKREINGIQHEFDAHKDYDGIPPY